MKENAIQKKCIEKAKERGVLAFKVVAIGRIGFPDVLLIFKGGRIVFVELKTKTGQLRRAQKRVIKKLREWGCEVHVINSVEIFEQLLESKNAMP